MSEASVPTKKRALRRHHKERMKRRAAKKLKQWDLEPTEDRVGRHADNMSICSCSMCGNKRYWEGETIQERKHRMDILYGVDEWEEMEQEREEKEVKEAKEQLAARYKCTDVRNIWSKIAESAYSESVYSDVSKKKDGVE